MTLSTRLDILQSIALSWWGRMRGKGTDDSLRLNEWQPLASALPAITERLAANGSDFILNHWDCKYLDARIDMRTGSVRLTAGNSERTRFVEWWPQYLKDHPRIDPGSAYEESIARHAWTVARFVSWSEHDSAVALLRELRPYLDRYDETGADVHRTLPPSGALGDIARRVDELLKENQTSDRE